MSYNLARRVLTSWIPDHFMHYIDTSQSILDGSVHNEARLSPRCELKSGGKELCIVGMIYEFKWPIYPQQATATCVMGGALECTLQLTFIVSLSITIPTHVEWTVSSVPPVEPERRNIIQVLRRYKTSSSYDVITDPPEHEGLELV